MYDDYSYDAREDYDYDYPPPSRRAGPQRPPPDDYPPERERERSPPQRSAPSGSRGPPQRAKYKPPAGPNHIPTMISICVILGILLMFIGIALLTIATPTTPPPERPKDYSSNDEYANDIKEWENDYYNARRSTEMIKQIGIVIHDLGAMLAGIALLGGGLMLNYLDMKLRTTLIISGIVLIVIMFIIPFSWSFISTPSYSSY